MLSDTIKQHYHDEYGLELSEADALDASQNLINFYFPVLKKIGEISNQPYEKNKKFQNPEAN